MRALGLALLLAPAVAVAQPVVEHEQETIVVTDNWNAPVVATGALVFLGSYGASVVVAGSSDHAGADRLYVPVAGPWLALQDWGQCSITSPSCDKSTTDKVLLVADGIFQAAGIVTMLDGLFEPTHHTVVTRTADTKLHITPTHNGVTMFAHF
jgi:hypothetical protein